MQVSNTLIINSHQYSLRLIHNFRISKQGLIARKLLSTTSPQELTSAVKNELKLSETCVKRLQDICKDGSFLRVTVEGGGCSGFQYKLEIANNLEKDDLQFGPEGAKVVIDETSIEYITGATVDYHTELIRAGFRIINNPKAEHGCSCGASFSFKIE